jgi:hypothetical protein
MMKKILIALGFAAVATSASASGLAISSTGSSTFNTVHNSLTDTSDHVWGGDGSTLTANLYTEGSTHATGTLYSTGATQVYAQYLGKVAAYSNDYMSLGNGNLGLTVGSAQTTSVGVGGLIDFKFIDGGDGSTFANGATNNATQGVLFFDATAWNAANGSNFDFLIGYNDTAGVNADYDDYVVGVIGQVPVPAALPLMASALGAFGISRRKNKAKAA